MAVMSPGYGRMVWWRYKNHKMNWTFGYTSSVNDSSLVRMGRWNGDTMGGVVVSVDEIEWRDYRT